MMKVILLAAMKGGCGKSTGAISLAGSMPGLTSILDMDAQGTSFDWTVFRKKSGLAPISAQRCSSVELPQKIFEEREKGVDWCIIDTSPASDAALLVAAKYAHVIFIPTFLNIADVKAIKTTIGLLKGFRVPQFVIENKVRILFGYAKRQKQGLGAIERAGGKVSEVFLPDTLKFPDSQAAGKTVVEYAPRSAAADQVNALGLLAASSVAA